MTIAYKCTDSWRNSIVAPGKSSVYYEVDEWVTAPTWLADNGYGIFVFNTLRDAMEFSRCFYRPIIWECEIEGIYSELPLAIQADGLEHGWIAFTDPLFCFPEGTIMVEKVKLIRKVTI
jgi:hypothetical protein